MKKRFETDTSHRTTSGFSGARGGGAGRRWRSRPRRAEIGSWKAGADGRTCPTVREESSVVNNYRQLSDTMQPLPYNRVDNALPL
jgi:hypothetical protein